ncbi:MAG: cytochrome c, partial [Anaerolineae bacterium]|nr:cytochrome c [Anaerolineae bacterium]
SALDPQAVERGKGRYEALECATCHGAAGEGTDDGASLITSTLNETDFISFMRSGGSIGPDHQYSTNRLSETGGKNLYQYLLSLRNS